MALFRTLTLILTLNIVPLHESSVELTAGDAPLNAALLAGDYVVPVGDRVIVGATHEVAHRATPPPPPPPCAAATTATVTRDRAPNSTAPPTRHSTIRSTSTLQPTRVRPRPISYPRARPSTRRSRGSGRVR